MIIAIFIYSLSGGGAERVVSYLLPYLMNRGHDVHLVLMNTQIAYELPENAKVHYLEKSKPFENGFIKLLKLPILAYKYAKLSKRLKLTHSFSLLSRPNYINVLMKNFNGSPPRIIVSERNYASMQYGYNDFQSKANNFLVKWLYNKADMVIGNSYANIKDLVDNYKINGQSCEVIQNPIDIDTINAIEPINGFFDENIFNMLTVGRLEVAKNHELLINAFSSIAGAKLYILGQGPLEERLKSQASDLGLADRIVFLGFDKNPYKYLKAADLFVFGSNHEGFPNVILEAMCCGLPILTTNCKSGPDELMKLDSPSETDIMRTPYGILSPVGDVELMTKGMNYFMQNSEYLESCRQNVSIRANDFEKSRILKTYEEVLSRA